MTLSAIVLLVAAGTVTSYFVFLEKTNKDFFSEVLNHFIKSWRKWMIKNPYILHELNWNELRNKKETETSFAVPKDKNLEDYFLLVKFEKKLNKFSFTIKKKKKDSFIVYSEDNGVLGAEAQSEIIAEVEELWTNEWNKEQKEKTINELEQIENINGKPVAKEEQSNTYNVNVQISGEDDQSEPTNFVVTVTIGPEDTDQDSKAWNSEWKILTASISAPGGEPEEVGLTEANDDQISEINTKISGLKTEKDKAAKLEAVKTALNAFSPQSEFITFADDWAANLDESTSVEADFNAPEGKSLTNYKLKVSYSYETITFEVISKTDNSQIWTSINLASGSITQASQIDSDLLTAIISKVEEEWGKEWKKESGQTFLTSLQNSFANLDKSELTTEINDSEDLDKEYETNFTLTKSSADGTEIDFTINLKFQLFSSDENAKVWDKEWLITEATYTLSEDVSAVETRFTFPENSDNDAKITKINTDLQTAAETEASVRKLKAFIEKLKTWDDNLLHTTTGESTWNSLSASNPVTLTFNRPVGKGDLSELTLKAEYENNEIVFKILDSTNSQIWSSSSVTSEDSIDENLKTTIKEQVENKWAEEWKEIQEGLIIELMNKKMDFRDTDQDATKITEDSNHYLTFAGYLPTFKKKDEQSFVVKVGVGPSETVAGLNLSDWKLLSANVEFGTTNPETVVVNDINNQRDLSEQIRQISKAIAKKASGSKKPGVKQIDKLIANSFEKLAEKKVIDEFNADLEIQPKITVTKLEGDDSGAKKILTVGVQIRSGSTYTNVNLYFYVKRWKLDLTKEDKIIQIKYWLGSGALILLELDEEFTEVTYDASGIHHYIVKVLNTVLGDNGNA